MTGFDDFMSKAGAAARTAAGAARRGAELAKLSIQIAAQEDKLKTAYAELGKLIYVGKPVNDAQVQEQMNLIRVNLEQLNALRRKKEAEADQNGGAAAEPEYTAGEDDFAVLIED